MVNLILVAVALFDNLVSDLLGVIRVDGDT